MKKIIVDLPSGIKNNEAKIFPLSDVHIEDSACNHKELLAWRNHVLEEDNHYVILNGDIINAALPGSKSNVFEATMTPDEAIASVVEFLRPLAEKNRIISACSGNHDLRIASATSIDPVKIICKELGIEDRYHPHACILFVSLGKSAGRDTRKQPYTIFHRHGNGGGGKIGSKANKVDGLANVIDCDLYIMSHVHEPLAYKKQYYRTDYRNKKMTAVDKTFVITNSWLNYENSYAVSLGCTPGSITYPVITLKGYEKKIEVNL